MKRDRIVIGLLGRMQHGKSTLAKELRNYFGSRSVSSAFADPLKNMLFAIDLTEAELWGGEKMRPTSFLGGHTPRRAMQTLGTEWGRELIYQNIWVDAWERSLDRLSGHVDIVIIEDVRFVNEVEKVKALGGILIEVHRPSMEPTTFWGKVKAKYQQLTAHPSEKINFRKIGAHRIVNSAGPEAMLSQFLSRHPELKNDPLDFLMPEETVARLQGLTKRFNELAGKEA